MHNQPQNDINIQDTLSYKEAAKMLGVGYNSLCNAVHRGVLTPLPRKGGKSQGKLSRQQVELFVSPPDRDLKKLLSVSNLSHDEAVIWHACNRAIEKLSLPQERNERPPIDVVLDGIERIASLGMDVMEEIAIAALDDRFDPLQLIDSICESPSFSKIMELLGVEKGTFKGFSPEEKKKLQESTERVASQMVIKFQQIQLRKMAMELERQQQREKKTA